jgi:hypothetical protein
MLSRHESGQTWVGMPLRVLETSLCVSLLVLLLP